MITLTFIIGSSTLSVINSITLIVQVLMRGGVQKNFVFTAKKDYTTFVLSSRK